MLLLLRLLLLRRMGTRLWLRLRLTPLLQRHGEETPMYLPSVVVVVAVAVAAWEELALVVYHLIILLKAHSRNIRHNNVEHREIAGSPLPFFFLRRMVNYLSLRVRGLFSSFLLYTGIIGVFVKHPPNHLYRPFFLFFPRGVLFFFLALLFLYHTKV